MLDRTRQYKSVCGVSTRQDRLTEMLSVKFIVMVILYDPISLSQTCKSDAKCGYNGWDKKLSLGIKSLSHCR